MFRASSVYPIQRLQQFRVHDVQAAQFGGGKSIHRSAPMRGKGFKVISQPQGFGLRAHGFTSLIASIASCA
jgi:hypothetical protein